MRAWRRMRAGWGGVWGRALPFVRREIGRERRKRRGGGVLGGRRLGGFGGIVRCGRELRAVGDGDGGERSVNCLSSPLFRKNVSVTV